MRQLIKFAETNLKNSEPLIDLTLTKGDKNKDHLGMPLCSY